jgi:hypothetical protein
MYRRYKLLFSYAPSIITAETTARIRTYVEAGGNFVVVLKPGVGMAEFSKNLLGIDATNAELVKGRIEGSGVAPWLTPARRVQLIQYSKIAPPVGAQPVLTAANGTPLAWVQKIGKGNVLVFVGDPDLQRSAGFVEELLKNAGITRLYDLKTVGEPLEGYPSEGILFANAKGQQILVVHRAIRWNSHRQMLEKVNSSGVTPTWDGFATVFPRKDIAVSFAPTQPGAYLIERWVAGQWTEIGRTAGSTISTAEMTLNLAPGEVGAMRFSRVP